MAENKVKKVATKSAAAKKPAAKAVKVAASKAAAVKKPAAAKKPAAKTATVAARKPAKPVAATKKAALSPQQHYEMVQVAAYYIAERHGFLGDPLSFWAAAETEIMTKLAKK